MMMHKNYKELAAAVLERAIKDYKRGGSATRREISMFLNSKNMNKGRPTFPLFCEILDVEPERWQAKFAQMQLDFALERALATAKAKNPKAVKALLDMEKVKLDGEQLLGLDDQLKELQKSDPYLFGDSKKTCHKD